jgi:hypothetical protein
VIFVKNQIDKCNCKLCDLEIQICKNLGLMVYRVQPLGVQILKEVVMRIHVYKKRMSLKRTKSENAI